MSKAGAGSNGAIGQFNGLNVNEIIAINRKHGGSTTLTGEVDTILANMSYYEGFYDKAAVAIRDIAGRHLFNDGNKRTAQAVIEQIAQKNGVNLNPSQIKNVIDNVATGNLRGIEDIKGTTKWGII